MNENNNKKLQVKDVVSILENMKDGYGWRLKASFDFALYESYDNLKSVIKKVKSLDENLDAKDKVLSVEFNRNSDVFYRNIKDIMEYEELRGGDCSSHNRVKGNLESCMVASNKCMQVAMGIFS